MLLVLLADFVPVPLLACVINRVLPLDESLQIGLIILATTAGAPFLVKEVVAATGNLSLGVGLMLLLMIVTMLVSIIFGLMYRSHSPEGTGQWAPLMNNVSGVALPAARMLGRRSTAPAPHCAAGQ